MLRGRVGREEPKQKGEREGWACWALCGGGGEGGGVGIGIHGVSISLTGS